MYIFELPGFVFNHYRGKSWKFYWHNENAGNYQGKYTNSPTT